MTSTRAMARASLALVLAAACGGPAGPTAPGEQLGPPDPAQSSVAVDRTLAIADGNDVIRVTVRVADAKKHPVPGASVVFSASGAENVVSPAVETDATGTAAGTLASTRAEAKTITAIARIAGAPVELEPHPAVEFTASDPVALAFTTTGPATVVAGAALPEVRVAIRDAHGNLVSQGMNEISLALTPGSPAAELEGAGPVAAAAGVAAFDAVRVRRAGAGYVLVASASGLRPATSAPFDVIAGPASRLAVRSAPASAIAGQLLAPALEVEVQDVEGNRVPGASSEVTVALAAAPPGAALRGTSVVTAIDGVATFLDLSLERAGAHVLEASAPGLAPAAVGPIVVGPAAPALAASALDVAPPSVRADGAATASVTVVVRDAFGNPVPATAVSLRASGADDAFVPAPPSGTTDAGGRFTAALASTRAERKDLTADVTGLFTLGGWVDFTPGDPDSARSTIAAAPVSAVADGTASSIVTVTVRDAHGNPVPGSPVALAVDGTGSALSPASGSTDGAGTFSASLASTVAEVKHLTATGGGLQLTGSVTFVPGPPSAARSSFTATPATVVADGAATATLDLVARDAQGNVITGAPVTFRGGSGATLSPADTATTDTSGRASVAVASTSAGRVNVDAQLPGAVTLTVIVAFVPGAPDAVGSSLDVSPAAVPAGGTAAVTIVAHVRDAHGNPVPGAAVTFSASGVANDLSSPGATTDASGAATVNLRSRVAQVESVTATVGTGPAAFSLGGSVSFVAPAFRDANTGLDGGQVLDLASSPASPLLLLAATGDGLFRSVDGGSSWAPTGPTRWPGARAVAFTADGGTALAVVFDNLWQNGTVYRSTDGGLTWVPSSTGLPAWMDQGTLAASADPKTVYLGTRDAVFRSTDAGLTWSQKADGPHSTNAVVRLVVDPRDRDVVYASASNAIYRSRDGGASWSSSASGLAAGGQPCALGIDPTVPSTVYAATCNYPTNGVYRSTDSGATWTAIVAAPSNYFVNAIRVDPRDSRIIHLGENYGVSRSLDGGATFSRVLDNPGYQSRVQTLALDPSDPARLWVGTGYGWTVGLGVYRSTDGGTTWTVSNAGLHGLQILSLVVDPQQPSTLYATAPMGVAKTTDGGASWTRVNAGLNLGSSNYVQSLAISPLAPATIYALLHYDGLYRTVDGGASWTRLSGVVQSYPSYPNLLVVSPLSTAIVYVTTTDSKLLRSSDGGATFTQLTGTPAVYAQQLVAAPTPTVETLHLAADNLYRSTDRGATFTVELSGASSVAVDPADPSVLYASTSTAIWRSTTGGDSWAQVGVPPYPACKLAVQPGTGAVLCFSSTRQGIQRSTDQGATWTALGGGLEEVTGVLGIAFPPGAPETFYVATPNVGVLKTTTGGR